MNSGASQPTSVCHVIAIPFPGRGDLKPLMYACEAVTSKSDNIFVTFVVTEEWMELLSVEPKRLRMFQMASVPNVLPSEKVRGGDILGFFKAVMTKMEAHVDQLLDRLEPPPSLLMADTTLAWAVRLGNRRNIPVASFFPLASSFFSLFHDFCLLEQNGDFPVDLSDRGNERVEYLPGLSSTRLVDLLGHTNGTYDYFLQSILEAFSLLPKAEYLLFATVYELEPRAIDAIRAQCSVPVFTLGPGIAFGNDGDHIEEHRDDCLRWLAVQPENSVLYMSMGSHLSVSAAQMHEITNGLRESGVRFVLVARSEVNMMKEACGEKGLVVPWCDQLRVLSHKSIGGFWSHCGWNSVKEGIFAGVPFLTFPLMADQLLNSKLVVEDWMIGWRVQEDIIKKSEHDLVSRQRIATIVKRFMDPKDPESKEMRARARELQKLFQHGIGEEGSSNKDINSFVKDISSRFCAASKCPSSSRCEIAE